jgi:hypothetical protein
VSFRWKDYADGNASKVMTLSGIEFVRRFLQHVLPAGFVRIRHFGLLANRCRNENVARCRVLLGEASGAQPAATNARETPVSAPPADRSESSYCCPVCGAGRMVVVEVWSDEPAGRRAAPVAGRDTS